MVFSSLIFLFVFLPAVMGFYYLAPQRRRNAVLLVFSYFFYLWGGGWFLGLLILSTMVDYLLGLLIDRSVNWQRRCWLSISIVFNLSFLAYFKYANFFIAQLNHTLSYLGLTPMGWTHVILPIGISFFTFHKLTYVVDVYRGTRRALSDFVSFALYVALFPQLIAGPIVRFHEISEQLKSRTENLENFYHGVLRFCWGLAKKTLLANPCGEIADTVFTMDRGSLDTKAAWIGVFAYTLQIYFDFSGYTDMALGLGLMFGFKLPENFNRPYSAVSITDFWRRWHMTLTNFFRDYLYIPLGGNRRGAARTYFNLVIVFVLCGFWHGARWTFLAWGLYHGALLVTERITGFRNVDATSYRLIRRFVTLLLIVVGWVIFRAKNLRQAVAFLTAMFLPSHLPVPIELMTVLNGRNLFFLSLAALVVFLPRDFSVGKLLVVETTPAFDAIRGGLVMILVLYSITFIASGSFNPFIYFQF